MATNGYCHCPECKKWVPASSMNYFDGMRVCSWCLNQEATPDSFVYDPYFGKTQCIMCDSYDTRHLLGPTPNKYICNECGEEFIL